VTSSVPFLPSAVTCAVVFLAGCGVSVAPPPAADPDFARECDPSELDAGAGDAGSRTCPSGQLCRDGRCYAACESDADCGPREACGPAGVCVPGARDASLPDAGPPDPCADVLCDAPLLCDPRTRSCVECSESTVGAPAGQPGSCSRFQPVCDISNGRCEPLDPRQCLPCNAAEDCVAPDGSFTGTCVLRQTLDVREQTCLRPCGGGMGCPSGLVCSRLRDETSGSNLEVCVPPVGLPCTVWEAGVSGRECLSDSDCTALGSVTALYAGACLGANPTADPPTDGSCRQPCGIDSDCFRASEGEVCGDDGFCRR
jgi:hypothetical protein